MKDLEFIRKHVKVWPEGATTVRLDKDGEICFIEDDSVDNDFYPDGYDDTMFNGSAGIGVQYTREMWSHQDLTKLDVTFGELDRDTQLRLVSHVLDGGDVEEHIVNDVWYVHSDPDNNDERGTLSFSPSNKYRALENTKNENQN